MVSDPICTCVTILIVGVLILVLVEDGLWLNDKDMLDQAVDVLILVLVEDGLWHPFKDDESLKFEES